MTKLLPPNAGFKTVKAALDAHLPFDTSLIFGCGLGMELQFMESEMLLWCLDLMREAGIIALPMHDGVMVPQSKAEDAQRIMLSVGLETTGVVFPVARK